MSPEEMERIQQFLTAFNAIEQNLREILQKDDEITFSHLVSLYRDRNPRWGDSDGKILKKFIALRNVIVHGPIKSGDYLSIPLLVDHQEDS
jgi:hypothetical protein